MLSTIYAAVARRRRERYAARPDARRRLRQPVISIGNIAAGGRGKTPFTATLVRLLMELGERPAILSRGYARTHPEDGVVIVRDAHGLRADLARSGDEPFMLARQLPGAIVMVSADRFIAGHLAEHHLGATVHLLDDGFQHLQLDRDIDIVLVAAADLAGGPTLPSGRLREPADVLVAADAIVAIDDGDVPARHGPVFRARRRTAAAVFDPPGGDDGSQTVLALAGIADPQPFLAAVRTAGWTVVAEKTFADHHAYSSRDVLGIFGEAKRAGASAVVTTEKDYVRLLPHRPFPVPVAWVPLTMEPEPAGEFRQWLVTSMAAARDIVLA